MSKKVNYSKLQAKFYNANPGLIPWPDLLVKKGLSILYRPKEIFLKNILTGLKFKQNDMVLDVGCGQGVFLARIVKSYRLRGVGIDVSPVSIRYANVNLRSNRLKYLVADSLLLPFKDNYFDKVVTFDTLEHIENQEKAVDEMVRVLKPGGKLLIHTLNVNDKYTLDWVWDKMGFDIYSRAFHKHSLFVDPSWIKRKLEKSNVKLDSIKFYDAFFTLAVDEIVMVLAVIMSRLGFGDNYNFGRMFLFVTSIISKIIYPVVSFLDNIWFSKGYSVGIVVTGEKQK